MATFPAAAYFNDAAPTEGEFKQALEDFLASVKAIPGAGIAELTNTISSGSITPAGSGGVVVVDTEAGGATDDLTNIVTTNYPARSLLLVRNSNAARFVVCKHLAGGAGQFNLDQGGDYTLDNTMKWLMLQRWGTDWFEVLRGPQRPLPVQSPIINGSMDVWQCGTTFTAPSSGSYTADRWLTRYAGIVWLAGARQYPDDRRSCAAAGHAPRRRAPCQDVIDDATLPPKVKQFCPALKAVL